MAKSPAGLTDVKQTPKSYTPAKRSKPYIIPTSIFPVVLLWIIINKRPLFYLVIPLKQSIISIYKHKLRYHKIHLVDA